MKKEQKRGESKKERGERKRKKERERERKREKEEEESSFKNYHQLHSLADDAGIITSTNSFALFDSLSLLLILVLRFFTLDTCKKRKLAENDKR